MKLETRARPEPGSTAPRVLIVDDVVDNREMYVDYFAYCGFHVLSASNGDQAVEVAREHRPDVIVMDLTMPGTDGWEATRRLKALPETRAIPVIVLTGHAEPTFERRSREAGCDFFLTKPCLPQELHTTVERCLTKSGVRAR